LRITLTGYSNEKEAELALKKSFYADMDKKRAEQAKKYLISKGIDGGRITVSGGGSSSENTKEIKEGDDDDLKMAKTRRVEFTVQ
jgi:OmpA-OmpF porin, OOP family